MKKSIKLAIALLLGTEQPGHGAGHQGGTIFPLSGGAGPDGQSVTNAVKLAIEQINEKGGLLGRKITLISKDDESTPAVGVSRANEMIAEKVDRRHRGLEFAGDAGNAADPRTRRAFSISPRCRNPI